MRSTKLGVISFLICKVAISASGSPLDLIPAFFNFFVLFTILFLILKKPVSEYFKVKSGDIKLILDRADAKSKEAKAMMDSTKKKMDNLQSEIQKIRDESLKEEELYDSQYKSDIAERIKKLEEDSRAKIKAEQAAQLNGLSEFIINNVISKTKEKLDQNPELAKSASEKVLGDI